MPPRCRRHGSAPRGHGSFLLAEVNGATGLMTVELWAIASVAGVVMKQTEETSVEFLDEEMEFLKSFAGWSSGFAKTSAIASSRRCSKAVQS
jgi:hypothetical protein